MRKSRLRGFNFSNFLGKHAPRPPSEHGAAGAMLCGPLAHIKFGLPLSKSCLKACSTVKKRMIHVYFLLYTWLKKPAKFVCFGNTALSPRTKFFVLSPRFVPVIKFSQTDVLVSGQYAPPLKARHLYCDLEGNQKENLSSNLL